MSRARWIAAFFTIGFVAAAIELACDGSSSSAGSECVHNLVFVKDIKEANPLASGQVECTANSDCTIRWGGDSCGCSYYTEIPNAAIDNARALKFDEKDKAIAACAPSCFRGCDASSIPLKAGCVDSRCVLVDASCHFDACTPDGGELLDASPSDATDATEDVIDASNDMD